MERQRKDRRPQRDDLGDLVFALRTSYIAGRIDGADPFAPPGLAEIDPATPCSSHHPCPAAALRPTG